MTPSLRVCALHNGFPGLLLTKPLLTSNGVSAGFSVFVPLAYKKLRRSCAF